MRHEGKNDVVDSKQGNQKQSGFRQSPANESTTDAMNNKHETIAYVIRKDDIQSDKHDKRRFKGRGSNSTQ